jgi:hypothetical protein
MLSRKAFVVLALVLASALSNLADGQPARAAGPVGMYMKGPGSATTCILYVAVNIPIYMNVPNDGRTWTTQLGASATDGTNSGSWTSVVAPLSPTAGEVFAGTMTGINIPSSTSPGALTLPFNLTYTIVSFADGIPVHTSTAQIRCEVGGGATLLSIANSGESSGGGGGFGGPALPEKRNLVLIGADTPVYDGPGGKPLATGQSLKACQTAYIIGTSEDGAWGQLFVMGGWIPLSKTTDVAENYGQPGGQPTLPQCVGR